MNKKFVEIDGKKFELKELAEETTEVVEEEVTEVVPEEKVEETQPEEEGISEADLDVAAEKLLKRLGIDKLQSSISDIKSSLKKADESGDKKVAKLVDLAQLMKKDVSQLTSKEKIVGFFQAMMQSDNASLKALSEGTAADGGYLFPDEFRAEVIRDIEEMPHMRNEVTIIPMKRDIMKIPTLTSGPMVSWTEENATKSTTTAHFDEATLTVKKMAAILYASDELIEDSTEIDIVNFIIQLFSEAIGREEDNVITAGNGTTEPTGYSIATSIASRSIAGSSLSFDSLIDLEYDLPAKYHRNAKYYAHRNNIRELRKLKDNQGRYLWQDPVSAGQPATFHGYPV